MASMAQRVVASAGSTDGQPVQQYPEVNPIMPSSLRTIPPWYEGSSFRHTSRLLVGVIPGAVLLITVTGTT